MDPQPQTVLDFWTDLIDNSRNYLKYYLSNDVTLDWFGQTVKGQTNVANFIKLKVNPLKHYLKDCQSKNKIGFRETHKIIVDSSRPTTRRMALLTPQKPCLMETPKKPIQQQPSTSRKRPMISQPKFDHKRPKIAELDANDNIDFLESENEADVNQKVKCLTSAGEIEFHRRSLKKLQPETKWRRPCKVHLAYEVTNNDVKDSTFYLIIYEGNVKCKRNLLRDFEQEEPEN